ncbi:Predicted nucleotide-binding protein containing TIR-like domain-containing protein [Chitinophaga sp. YR627]|uniref:TIR domain-containing protein n=1 Tax=Chitinophaga sp. YR627 TaxID=1881041 RepID=UPI0008F29B12|nr:TIR domain-containing protein [Chitinophaga sp. YR627]SFO75808.1 Predicted nucleotide-binding protein containing TIR-like domain-containing protein [Chitinophaga sp. YR627]
MKSIFICSSSEALDVVLPLEELLSEKKFSATIWRNGTFGLGQQYIESIIRASKEHDYAVIILSPDGGKNAGENETYCVKDNVIFEMGLFISAFNKERTFFLVENTPQLKLPGYIAGLNTATYVYKSERDLLKIELKNACNAIEKAILQQNGLPSTKEIMIKTLVDKSLRIACEAISNPFMAAESTIRIFFFKLENGSLRCKHYWAAKQVIESNRTSFEINEETEKQVAVVMAFKRRRVIGVAISVLPKHMEGVQGEVDANLCYVLAIPIFDAQGDVWGVIDFDASNSRGENILRRETTSDTLFQLGNLIYEIYTSFK